MRFGIFGLAYGRVCRPKHGVVPDDVQLGGPCCRGGMPRESLIPESWSSIVNAASTTVRSRGFFTPSMEAVVRHGPHRSKSRSRDHPAAESATPSAAEARQLASDTADPLAI